MAHYFHRSFLVVDGLWFMKAEELYGFEAALDLDEMVWKVLPKIQARMLKSMLGEGDGIDSLMKCLKVRLDLEGFDSSFEDLPNGFAITITRCPWKEIMARAGRESLNQKVGERICQAENLAWAKEFGPDIEFRREGGLCSGSSLCSLRFEITRSP
ncbi:MAG: L-2-amino-thiazoline-4-carboxylic acid hydrolase [Methanotrichaceae archaeon]|nr:L-2-amino-thiazoline-4-carboxylic acid hydrolase [Methanotrichaceae archaeon]